MMAVQIQGTDGDACSCQGRGGGGAWVQSSLVSVNRHLPKADVAPESRRTVTGTNGTQPQRATPICCEVHGKTISPTQQHDLHSPLFLQLQDAVTPHLGWYKVYGASVHVRVPVGSSCAAHEYEIRWPLCDGGSFGQRVIHHSFKDSHCA
jgi:hypothetical protein